MPKPEVNKCRCIWPKKRSTTFTVKKQKIYADAVALTSASKVQMLFEIVST